MDDPRLGVRGHLRGQARGRGLTKIPLLLHIQAYVVSLPTEGGVKNWQNLAYVVY